MGICPMFSNIINNAEQITTHWSTFNFYKYNTCIVFHMGT